MNEIRNNIIERIKKENIKMKPRWHFVLKGVLMFLSIMILLLIVIYLFSFLILFVNSESFVKMPADELRDFINLSENLPWVIIFFSLIGFLIVETLVSKYEFSNRKPFLYSFTFTLLVIVISGYTLGDIKYHAPIRDRAPFNKIYDRYNMRGKMPDQTIQIIEVREPILR